MCKISCATNLSIWLKTGEREDVLKKVELDRETKLMTFTSSENIAWMNIKATKSSFKLLQRARVVYYEKYHKYLNFIVCVCSGSGCQPLHLFVFIKDLFEGEGKKMKMKERKWKQITNEKIISNLLSFFSNFFKILTRHKATVLSCHESSQHM